MNSEPYDLDAVVRQIEAANSTLNAFVSWRSVGLVQTQDHRAPLQGVPVAVKDNFCTRHFKTTCASQLLHNYQPPYNATVVDRLEAAGAAIVGKTNLDEFGMGSSTEHSVYGPTLNPWDTSRVPGGSSGGSAAAVAAGLVPAAIGSDTGGSVRQPAAFCGVTGFKPTRGVLSRFGLVAFASSLDTVGIIARNTELVQALMTVLAGRDPADSTSIQSTGADDTPSPAGALAGLRLGIFPDFLGTAVSESVERAFNAALNAARSRGASIEELPPTFSLEDALAAYHIIADAEASSNLARFDGVRYGARGNGSSHALPEMYRTSRSEGFGDEVQRRIALGTFVLSRGFRDQFYERAQSYRHSLAATLAKIFSDRCDLLASPTTPETAFELGAKVAPLELYRSDLFTLPASLAGLPAVSIPCGLDGAGLPIGLQLIGPPRSDARLLAAAHALEGTLNKLPTPPLYYGGAHD